MSNVIKARSVIMPGAPAPSGEAGFPLLRIDRREAARWWLAVAPLSHMMQRRIRDRLAAAHEEAAAIVAAATAEADAIRTGAREEGYQAGLAAGQTAGAQAARAELQQLLDALRSALDQLRETTAAAGRRHEEEIVELALAVAARLSRRADVLGPETVRAILREVLPRAAGAPAVAIRLHPADLAALQAEARELEELVNGGGTVTWVADEHISRGGCMVDTDRGQLDARVETRFARVAESLADVVRGGC